MAKALKYMTKELVLSQTDDECRRPPSHIVTVPSKVKKKRKWDETTEQKATQKIVSPGVHAKVIPAAFGTAHHGEH